MSAEIKSHLTELLTRALAKVAPQQPGDYIIEFDMVAEHVTWFEDFGAGVLRHGFSVA